MKCWLSSFPRSGNTFFRNILYYVYGIKSSSWHKEPNKSVKEDYDQYDFVKTHLLPKKIVPCDPNIPAIYLVRDGRDSLVSIAHHRSDIVFPGSDFSTNLYEAIVAEKNSFFGGWSQNITSWLDRATIVIKYEDLIKDQKAVFKRVEQIIPLPKANWSNLPSFKEMKFGNPKYGGKKPNKFFRKGKSGSWQDEMTKEQLDLFWHFHGDTMERLGYQREPAVVPQNSLMDLKAIDKMSVTIQKSAPSLLHKKKHRVLIDCNLFFTSSDEYLKTHLKEMILGLIDVKKLGNSNIIFDLLVKDKVYSIKEFPKIKLFDGKSVIPFKRLSLNTNSIRSRNLPKYASYVINKIYSTIYLSDFYHSLNRLVQKKEGIKLKSSLQTVINHAEKRNEAYDLAHVSYDQYIPNIKNSETQLVITKSKVFFYEKPDWINSENTHFISTSGNIRKLLEEEWNIKTTNIHDIFLQGDKRKFHQNLHPKITETVLKRFGIQSDHFIICNSDLETSANLSSIIKGFNDYKEKRSTWSLPLVIVGKHAEKIVSKSTPKTILSSIHFLGHVDDPFMHVLYSSALLSFSLSNRPSLPFEALFCGTPVIFSQENPFAENLHNCGVSVNAQNPADIANKLNSLITDKSFREDLSRNAISQSFQFSRRKTSYDILQLYLACLNEKL